MLGASDLGDAAAKEKWQRGNICRGLCAFSGLGGGILHCLPLGESRGMVILMPSFSLKMEKLLSL